jgi:hypothetical protein
VIVVDRPATAGTNNSPVLLTATPSGVSLGGGFHEGTFQIFGRCGNETGTATSARLRIQNNAASPAEIQWNGNTTGAALTQFGRNDISATAMATASTDVALVGPGAGVASFAANAPDGTRLVGEGMAFAAGNGNTSWYGGDPHDCAFSVTLLQGVPGS